MITLRPSLAAAIAATMPAGDESKTRMSVVRLEIEVVWPTFWETLLLCASESDRLKTIIATTNTLTNRIEGKKADKNIRILFFRLHMIIGLLLIKYLLVFIIV
jgi:hypothetical protein